MKKRYANITVKKFHKTSETNFNLYLKIYI